MSVLPTFAVGSPNRFAGPAVPSGGMVTGPLGAINVGTVQVVWRASGSVSVSLVSGSVTVPVGSGAGGSAVVNVASGLWAFQVQNTSGAPLDSVIVSMGGYSSLPDPLEIGSVITRSQPVVNVLAFGADPTGTNDSTAAIQAAIDAAGAGDDVYIPAGAFIVTPRTLVAPFLAALVVNSGCNLVGPGTIRHAPGSFAATTDTVCLVLMQSSGNVRCRLDCNRDNLGPFAYGTALGSYQPSGVVFSQTTGGSADVDVDNSPAFAVTTSGAEHLRLAVRSTNCTAACGVSGGSSVQVPSVLAKNADPALTVNTTADTTLTAGSYQTCTPASMAGIAVGSVLMVGLGTDTYENVLVTAVTSTAFTAYFGAAHSGTYTVTNGLFYSDSACSVALASNIDVGTVNVDYSEALCLTGAACEVYSSQGVTVEQVVSTGAWRTVWVHNFGTTRCTDVDVASFVGTNCRPEAGGLAPTTCFLDDDGFAADEALENVRVAGVCVYGRDGAAVPTNATGFADSGSTVNCTVDVIAENCQCNSTSALGNNLTITTRNAPGFSVYCISTGSTHKLVMNGGASHQLILDSTVSVANNTFDVTALNTATGYQSIRCTPTTAGNIADNVFTGNVNGGYIVIPGTPAGNIFRGFAQFAAPQTAPTVPASGTALTNPFPFDTTVYVSGGTVSEIAIGGTSTGLTSGAFDVPAGQSITLTYSVAPTWVWVGN